MVISVAPGLSRIHYTLIFLIAFATLACQVLATRILSVTFYYHLAFAGITFAMLGLTAGALRVYIDPARFSAARTNREIAHHAVLFSIFMPLAALMHINGWLFEHSRAISLVISAFLFIYGFIFSGVCVTLLLTRFPAATPRLYAFDLAGAACGCIAIVGLLKIMDPLAALFFLCAGVAFAAAFIATGKYKRIAFAAAVVLALLMAAQEYSHHEERPLFSVQWAKNEVLPAPLFERWNTYSRVYVYGTQEKAPFGWGFGKDQSDKRIDQLYLRIDAGAGTVITHFNGDTAKLSYLKNDVINLGYSIRPIQNVAVIGVGGGRDILSALIFGAKHVTGIEMNPAIFEAVNNRFGEFTGHLNERPDVDFINAEARSYLASSPNHYDLVQISLIDTWAATAAGGLTLSENKLYTVEAWKEFLGHLNPEGMLVVSRWYEPGSYDGEFYRLLAIAAESVRPYAKEGDIRRHILAANARGIITVAVSRTPYSEEDIARFYAACEREHFRPMLTPREATDATAAYIASGSADAAYFKQLPLDVSPPTDDRPFFFNMLRPLDLLGAIALDPSKADNNMAAVVLFFLLAVTLVMSGFYILRPLYVLSKRGEHRPKTVSLSYFALIGLGFMLIEIAQMQRLMIFLGHPVYGLSVVLFTLLFFGGLGSYTMRSLSLRSVWLRPLVLCAVLLMVGLITPWITSHVTAYGTGVRIAASVALLAPAGLCMGMMFPLGITLHRVREESLLSWFWGVNGIFSVLASILGVEISMMFGIAATYWTGVACYMVCLLCALALYCQHRVEKAS